MTIQEWIDYFGDTNEMGIEDEFQVSPMDKEILYCQGKGYRKVVQFFTVLVEKWEENKPNKLLTWKKKLKN